MQNYNSGRCEKTEMCSIIRTPERGIWHGQEGL